MTASEKVPSPIPSESPMDIPYEKCSTQTPYMVMSVQANQARRRYNIGAGISAWLILAGYIVLPNTFTSLKASKTLSGSKNGKLVQNAVQNIELLPLAGILCFIGVVWTCKLWYTWRKNYVWLITRIFV